MWWTFAKQQANGMADFLRSRKIEATNSLIFDGAFVPGKSNPVDYRQRMKSFAWKVRAIDAELPKPRKVSYRGRASLLPGPFLPGMTRVNIPAPTGAWTQPYVNDNSISTDSSRFVDTYAHNTWRAEWVTVVAELTSHEYRAL
jgi:hypothetical protein